MQNQARNFLVLIVFNLVACQRNVNHLQSARDGAGNAVLDIQDFILPTPTGGAYSSDGDIVSGTYETRNACLLPGTVHTGSFVAKVTNISLTDAINPNHQQTYSLGEGPLLIELDMFGRVPINILAHSSRSANAAIAETARIQALMYQTITFVDDSHFTATPNAAMDQASIYPMRGTFKKGFYFSGTPISPDHPYDFANAIWLTGTNAEGKVVEVELTLNISSSYELEAISEASAVTSGN